MELLRPSSLDELDGGRCRSHGGTEVVPLLRDGILAGRDARRHPRRRARAASTATCIGAGTTLAELEVDPQIPEALREACRLAASPQLRNMGSVGGNLLQATRCWYWRLEVPVPPARRRPLPRAGGRASRARDLRERLLRVGAPVRHRGGAARARRAHAHDARASCRSPSCTGCRTRANRARRDARAGRADPRARAARRSRRAPT